MHAILCLSGEGFSLRRLGKIKYTGAGGRSCELTLLEEMSVKWDQVGDLVGLSAAKLKSIRSEFSNNEECMRSVATEWMQRDPEEVQHLSPFRGSVIRVMVLFLFSSQPPGEDC